MKTKGLTFREAKESGRLFKLPGWVDWWKVSDCGNEITSEHGDRSTLLSVIEAAAEDWEIKATPREFWILRRLNTIDTVVHHPDLIDNYKDLIEVIHVKEVLK